ncbi:transporter [Pseudomonas cremoricolorata]|uniref:Phenol degradation protein meta n=1 Tax=Pseudomonas cremoricolorata TaxID=157783 RepID=A0A089WNZ6_9PSED|nr:transporter [Pseudomonas cremoricolorata]AIR90296.1 phenol degradation protein meta [Pseudomonas cremoricolorata]
MKIIRIVPLLATLPWAHSQAIEVAPGDYEPLPAGADAVALYYQHAERKALYADGDRVSDNARLKSDVGILRYIHAVGLAENLVWEPQVLLPFGYLNASGDVGALGDTHGIGDPILAAPLKWTLPTTHGDIFSLAPYLFVPVGSYDKDDALNLGENRWRATLQAAYIHRFTPRLALDTVAEASWVSSNNDFGPAGVKLEEDTRYEYQMALRYALTEKTSVALGGGYVTGAATTVDGVDQHNRLSTSYGRLTVSHFIEPTLQVQAQLGQDFEVEEGFKERARLNLRILKVF